MGGCPQVILRVNESTAITVTAVGGPLGAKVNGNQYLIIYHVFLPACFVITVSAVLNGPVDTVTAAILHSYI